MIPGISGLNTTSGSITQGTPSTHLQQKDYDDNNMDTSQQYPLPTYNPLIQSQQTLYNIQPPPTIHAHHILNIHNHRSLTNSPISNPGSPGLDMIKEEQVNQTFTPNTIQSHHPQISVTDVLGSEITLVASSDTSEDSMDSLENQTVSNRIPQFIISEPIENGPSITKGTGGRKISSELENTEFGRRNSDKSSCYSEDSLSNDSLSVNHPSPTSANHEITQNFENMYLQTDLVVPSNNPVKFDLISDCRSSGFDDFYELTLSKGCAHLESGDILEIVKEAINNQIPPKCFVLRSHENVNSGLIEYEGGIQIEVKVCEDKVQKGLKMRRISGDHLIYNQLCQQLISCMSVS